MPRKVMHKENNSERWLVSYADMLTLLLGLFVVLYATKQDDVSENFVQESIVSSMQKTESDAMKAYGKLPEQLQNILERYVELEKLELSVSNKFIEVIVFNENLFELGSSDLNYKSVEPLFKLASILKNTKNKVVVEGYTDNLKIAGGKFPSNWELSSARASSVLRYLEKKGVDSSRMLVVGHGSNKPAYANDTEEGRKKNRRVVVKILRDF